MVDVRQQPEKYTGADRKCWLIVDRTAAARTSPPTQEDLDWYLSNMGPK